MRSIATLAAFALAGASYAGAPAPAAPAAAEAPATVVKSFEVKSFEPKALELGADLEIKTKDVGAGDLDRKLASKKNKAAADGSSVMRAPSKPAILEAADAEAAAEAAATAPATAAPAGAPSRKDNAGSR